jgi:hypothetical protein
VVGSFSDWDRVGIQQRVRAFEARHLRRLIPCLDRPGLRKMSFLLCLVTRWGPTTFPLCQKMGGPFRSHGPKPRGSHGGRRHASVAGSLNSGFLYLNETAPRWENHSRSASLRPPCFALVSRHQSLAQTAPLARATNLRIKANPVPPPPGFVQEPVPERPQRLAVKPRHLCRPFVYRLLPFSYQTPVQF